MDLLYRLFTAVATLLVGAPACGVTIRSGAAYTESGNQDRRPLHWRDGLLLLDPKEAPFLHMLLKLGKERVTDPEFKLFEDEDMPAWTRVNNGAGYSDSDTSVVVDEGSIWDTDKDARIIVPRTGEIMKVTGVSSNTLTVVRGHNGTTAAALLDNDHLCDLGEIFLEGDTMGSIRTTVPVTVTNYTEIFREAYGFTGTNAVTKKRGGPNDPERDRMLALRRLRRKIERSFRFGIKTESVSGSTIERHTGGLEQFVTTNVFNLEGAISEPDLAYIAEKVFRYGTGEKLVLCGREARLQLDNLGLMTQTVSANDPRNVLGLSITKYESSFGMLNFVTDHSLENGYADRIHIIDVGNADIAVLRALEHLKDRQANDADLVKNEYLCEWGMYLAQEKSHAVIKGVTSSV
jgi:hypothetical protein